MFIYLLIDVFNESWNRILRIEKGSGSKYVNNKNY